MTRSRTRRAFLVAAAAAALAVSAVGPSGPAGAVPRVPAAQPAGFLPSPTPVRVTAPTLRITDLLALTENQSIPLAGGAVSPRGSVARGGTVLLRFARIELDNVSITQAAGGSALSISDPGSGQRAATIGGAGGVVELWGVLKALQVCLPASTLRELAGLGDVDASSRRSLKRLLVRAERDADPAGPCTDVRPLVPLLSRLARQRGRLPRTISGKGLDIAVYALRANAGGRAMSLVLPHGRVAVRPR